MNASSEARAAGIPEEYEKLRSQLEQWRKNRTGHTPAPDEFWTSAAPCGKETQPTAKCDVGWLLGERMRSDFGPGWKLSEPGMCLMHARVGHGYNEWIPSPLKSHRYLIEAMPPAEVGKAIEDLMIAPPRRK